MKRALAIAAVALLVLVAAGAAADSYSLTIVAQTSTTITFSYPQQSGYGYLYSANGTVVSRTNNSAQTTVRFSKNAANSYDVDSIVKGTNGHCCALPPEPSNVTMGETDVLPSLDNGNGNLLVAQRATLTQPGTLESLSFYVTNAAGSLRLGVYSSTGPGGGPGQKLAETASFTAASGWNTQQVQTPAVLAAGTYWLAYLPSSNNLAFVKADDGTSVGSYYSFTFGPLPGTFSPSPASTPSHWSFYATVATSGPPPPPPPPQCSDSADNDADGKIDYPADPGCSAATDNDETDPSPPGNASVFVSASGSDSNPCSQSQPCRSLNRAFQAAQCGAIVQVSGGTYPSQDINANPALANCSSRVVFEEAQGQTASFGSVGINYPASHVELRNLAINPFIDVGYQNPGFSCGNNPARDIKLVDIDVQSFHIGCVDGLDWQGGDVGPSNSDTVEHPYINDATGYIPKNIVLSGIYFHDAIQGSSGTHTECLLVVAADGLTVQNSTFSNCQSTGPLYITVINLAGAQATCRGIVVQNNWFFGNGSQAAHFENDCDILVRYNSFSAGAFPYLLPYNNHPGGSQRTVTLVGNYGTAPRFEGNGSCPSPPSNFVFSYNVFVGTTCAGPGNVSVSATNFVNPSSDLHLLPGANAIDRGDPANYPATDKDGNARYLGSAPDAGADEAG